MSVSPLAIVLALLAAAGVALIVRGTLVPRRSETDLLEERLAKFKDLGDVSLRTVELSLPFFERAIRPTLDRVGTIIAARMPNQARDRMQRRLDLAGRPLGLSLGGYQAVRIVWLALALLITYIVAITLSLTGQPLLLAFVFGVILGVLPPLTLLTRAAQKRQHEIRLGLAPALDLITISVEAGLGFDAAVARVTEKYKNALALELTQYLNEIRLGRTRSDAMADIGQRTEVEELNTFVQAIIQSEQLGVGIANVLRIQSEDLRRRRRQRAEEAGQKAPLKMLFPMVGCIFPVLFIVLLGPAALTVANGIGHH